jgi:hypothetical protein
MTLASVTVVPPRVSNGDRAGWRRGGATYIQPSEPMRIKQFGITILARFEPLTSLDCVMRVIFAHDRPLGG